IKIDNVRVSANPKLVKVGKHGLLVQEDSLCLILEEEAAAEDSSPGRMDTVIVATAIVNTNALGSLFMFFTELSFVGSDGMLFSVMMIAGLVLVDAAESVSMKKVVSMFSSLMLRSSRSHRDDCISSLIYVCADGCDKERSCEPTELNVHAQFQGKWKAWIKSLDIWFVIVKIKVAYSSLLDEDKKGKKGKIVGNYKFDDTKEQQNETKGSKSALWNSTS
ncbi:hypothetical protein Tco_0996495, partial [Tanacetum coccineum]